MEQRNSEDSARRSQQVNPEARASELSASYEAFVKSTVTQFKKESLALDFYLGVVGGHQGEDVEEENFVELIGKNGIFKTLASLLSDQELPNFDVPKALRNLLDDIYNLQRVDEYHWRTVDKEPLDSTFIKRTVQHFNSALLAYVELEKSRGKRTEDSPETGIDNTIDNPTLLRLYLIENSKNYNSSFCEFHH